MSNKKRLNPRQRKTQVLLT